MGLETCLIESGGTIYEKNELSNYLTTVYETRSKRTFNIQNKCKWGFICLFLSQGSGDHLFEKHHFFYLNLSRDSHCERTDNVTSPTHLLYCNEVHLKTEILEIYINYIEKV